MLRWRNYESVSQVDTHEIRIACIFIISARCIFLKQISLGPSAIRMDAINELTYFSMSYKTRKKKKTKGRGERTGEIKLPSLTLYLHSRVFRVVKVYALTRNKSKRYVTAHKVTFRHSRVSFDRGNTARITITFISINPQRSPHMKKYVYYKIDAM